MRRPTASGLRPRFSIRIALPVAAALVASAALAAAPPLDPTPASRPATQPSAATRPVATSEPAAASESITIAGETFVLELAVDTPSRTKGLMGRTSIAEHGGMLFVFDDELERSFWMANCLTDMDIAFLDSKGRITATHAMKAEKPQRENESLMQYEARLKSYVSRRPAQFAIELKASTIARLKLKPGQMIDAEWKRIAKLAK